MQFTHQWFLVTLKYLRILEIVPPPELNLLIGPVNTLFEALSKVWSESEKWLSLCNVKKNEYHGGSFAGNDSRKLLNCASILKEMCPKEFERYVDTFNLFNGVVTACYSKDLDKYYLNKIDYFKKKYLSLKIYVTPKVHAVMYHDSEFCELKGMGLAPWSEQTSEFTSRF